MSKSLSNGTLSLRFMQNALRRQNLPEVEPKRAEIKDEAKWEVGQDIKDAWGIGSKQSSDSVAHESSYLPFLFSSEREDVANSTSKPRGRRTFNKHGLDVSQDQLRSQLGRDDVGDVSGAGVITGTASPKDRIHANPALLNANSSGNSSLQGFDTSATSTITRRSGSARDAIFSLSGVGTDLRTEKLSRELLNNQLDDRTPKEQERRPPSIGFLKPMGVDEPIRRNPDTFGTLTESKMLKTPVPNDTDGARKKKRRRHPKDQADGETQKKRKIKRSILSRPADKE